ncbi:saccharopine dehydrogenase family protein [Lentibacillus sp. Marseille-P4043]|uniref:saccharopine dehydrogenase family protein n=1 Tax=Lentibacillus sp. Marseille-P4043 TaxID=2040293 RepID=UPI000D0AC0CD|nr:saccharopine dehydrogenase C-terminal domain-containing protein [Lentibacillus sp. Marseille-P4043]
MNVVVLGGSGLQGRAALQDLSHSSDVTGIVCGDVNFNGLDSFSHHLNMDKINKKVIDATNIESLIDLFIDNVDVAIDLLPKQFNNTAVQAAIEANVPLVNCSYANGLSNEVYEQAKKNAVTIIPEAGLDPGIDLILCGYGVSQLDEVNELYSYCGGIPDANAIDNLLKYKISWNLDSTLMSYKRPAKMLKNGNVIDIPAKDQHSEKWLEEISFPGIDNLESTPNGNAIKFAKLFGIEDSVRNTERRTIRWAGHANFWRKMVDLGFLETEPVHDLPAKITPHQFMVAHLEPRLQYGKTEKDLVLMKNIIRGKKDGQKVEITYDMVARRDLTTGLFAMNRTVGYTASIVAQMIAKKIITKTGVLSPTTDIPFELFIKEISKRGIKINETKKLIK